MEKAELINRLVRDGYSYREIARMINSDKSTVHYIFHRYRRDLVTQNIDR